MSDLTINFGLIFSASAYCFVNFSQLFSPVSFSGKKQYFINYISNSSYYKSVFFIISTGHRFWICENCSIHSYGRNSLNCGSGEYFLQRVD